MIASGGTIARILVLALGVAALACTEPPTREMNQAQGAIEAARAAGAAEYATEEFKAAEAALLRSHQAVEERDYRQALNHALDARDRAQTAAGQAADEKARVRTEADRHLRTAESALERLNERLNTPPAARLPAAALTPIRTAIDAVTTAVDAARGAFDRGDYRAATATLADVETRLGQITSEIDAAVTDRPTRRPARRNR
jgi:hypothetical protein